MLLLNECLAMHELKTSSIKKHKCSPFMKREGRSLIGGVFLLLQDAFHWQLHVHRLTFPTFRPPLNSFGWRFSYLLDWLTRSTGILTCTLLPLTLGTPVHHGSRKRVSICHTLHTLDSYGRQGEQKTSVSSHGPFPSQFYVVLRLFTFFSATSAGRHQPVPHYLSPQSPGTSESHSRHGLLNRCR